MGILEHTATGEERTLSVRTLVGRSAACLLQLTEARVSGEHATLWYREPDWWIRDLGSRNGTWVDGERLVPGSERRLTAGARLGFGAEALDWELADASAPRPRAREIGGGTLVAATGDLIVLPPDGPPELSVVRRKGNVWQAEGDADVRPVRDGSTVVAGDRAWRLMLPGSLDPTQVDERPVALRFRVSADEETVDIDVLVEGALHTLASRSAHYLLLLLARQRTADAGLPPEEQGWVQRTELARQLGVSPRTVNVQLHRLRQQLAAVKEGLAGRLLEHRGARTGQIRLGISDVAEARLGER